MSESGIADFIMTFWSGVVAPAGTVPDIVTRLNAAIDDGLKSAASATASQGGIGSRARLAAGLADFISDRDEKVERGRQAVGHQLGLTLRFGGWWSALSCSRYPSAVLAAGEGDGYRA